MNLAARCTACGTVFRVVQDQLRVSEGWVRCGRCSEVFNAIENLVDVDADVVTARPPPVMQVEHIAPAPDPSPSAPAIAATIEAGDTAPATVEPGHREVAIVPAPVAETAGVQPRAPVEALPATASAAPGFVRRAEQAARWQRPRVRIALGTACGAAGAMLTLQIGLAYRDTLAAHWPVLRPALQAACSIAGCVVGPARWMDALAVESSALVRIEGTALYRLSLALKNRSDATVAVPSLDLSLTDGQGSLMARRVILAHETGIPHRDLAPRAELTVQATVATATKPVAGYTIEIFYP